MMRTEQVTPKDKEFISPWWIIGATGIIFLAAFALNFVALSRFAADVMEVDLLFAKAVDFVQESILPYAFPFLVDVFLLMATAVLLRNAIVGETARLAIVVIVFTSILAVTLNAMHYNVYEYWSQGNYRKAIAGGIYSIAVPAAILLTSEIVRGLLQSVQQRSVFVQTTAQLKEEATQAQVQLNEVAAQLETQQKERDAQQVAQEKERDTHQQQLNDILSQVDAAKTQLQELQAQASKPSEEWVQSIQLDTMLGLGVTHKLACKLVGFSENTGRTRLERYPLNGNSMIGRGVEIRLLEG